MKEPKKTPPKFLSLFATLDKGELSEFGKFLRKHYFHEKVPLEVFHYFKQFHAEIVAHKSIDLDLAAQQLAKTGVVKGHYSRKRLHDNFHDLYGMLKHFLLLKKLGDDSLESEAFWLKVQKERGLKAEFEKGAYRRIDHLRTAPKLKEEDYLMAMLVEFLDCGGHIAEIPPDDAKLQAYAKALEGFYQLSRLKLSCEIVSQSNIKGRALVQYENVGVGGVGVSGQYLHGLYSQVLLMLQDGDEAAFKEATKLLAKFDAQLSKDERQSVSKYLQNFCAGKIRQGRSEYSKWSFEIYKSGLMQGLYFNEQMEIGLDTYFNILSAGIAAGDVKQAAQFIHDYLPHITDSYSDEVGLLSNALLFFGQRQYKKALGELKKLERRKIQPIRGRLLRIACMLGQDLRDIDVQQEVINCRNFLVRNVPVHEKTWKAANNFLGIVHSICAAKKSAAKIREEIEAAKDMVYMPWLLELLKGYKPNP